MTENKRYFKKEYDEEFYILDSEVISEKDFEEKLDYQGYIAFEGSLTTDEIVGLLNENEQLKSQNENLKSNIDDLMNMELEDRDIVCQAGKFRLEEWGKHRLHQFYDGDTPLEDESVVIRLLDLTKENKQLKSQINDTQIAVEIAIEECMQRVFHVIDEKIEKYEGARYIPDVLRLLKKELQS